MMYLVVLLETNEAHRMVTAMLRLKSLCQCALLIIVESYIFKGLLWGARAARKFGNIQINRTHEFQLIDQAISVVLTVKLLTPVK